VATYLGVKTSIIDQASDIENESPINKPIRVLEEFSTRLLRMRAQTRCIQHWIIDQQLRGQGGGGRGEDRRVEKKTLGNLQKEGTDRGSRKQRTSLTQYCMNYIGKAAERPNDQNSIEATSV
jgi:hypothetical protein